MSEKDIRSLFSVSDSGNGFHTVTIERYEEFTQLLGATGFRDYPEYVFRGHRDPSWPLLPSLYRRIEQEFSKSPHGAGKLGRMEQEQIAGEKTSMMLRHFIYGLRGTSWQEHYHELLIEWFEGKRSPHINELHASAKKDSKLWAAVVNTWATGQHFGLFTPLLDWTESPLVAFYFAFEQPDERIAGEESRVVYALNRKLIQRRCDHKSFAHTPLDFVTPFTKNNPRLIAQHGLFTHSHIYQSVDKWVTEIFQGEDLPVLIRLLIRNVKTTDAVRWLNRHGINERNLFPDLTGISRFSNRAFNDHNLDHL